MSEGAHVTVIDDLSTGRYANIGHLEGAERFRLVIDTVLNKTLVEELVKDTDVVYHLASAVGVSLIIDQPVKTIETIVGGTDVVLNAARRYRKRVLITSTSEVYGKGAARSRFRKTTTRSKGRPASGAGPTRTRRRWTSFSRWPIGRRRACR